MNMMEIRQKILATLDRNPDKRFSIEEIARFIGFKPKITSAALNKLLKKGVIGQPDEGYFSKTRPPVPTPPPELTKSPRSAQPTKPPKRPERQTTPKPPQQASPSDPPTELSVVTIDLLFEGDKSGIDAGALLRKIQEDKTVHDAKVRKVTEADPKKLQMRFALPDEE